MSSKTVPIAGVFCIVMGVLAGCTKPPAAMRQDRLEAEDYPQKVALEGLHRAVVVGDPIVTPSTADIPMRVTVPVRSVHSGAALNVQYRFEFFGPDKRPLRSNLGWKFISLEPRVQMFLEGNAMEAAAADWRLILRPAR